MAALTIKSAAFELAAAIEAFARPLHDAVGVAHGIAAIEFRSPEIEREVAAVVSSFVVELRRSAKESTRASASILAGLREFEKSVRGRAAEEVDGEENES